MNNVYIGTAGWGIPRISAGSLAPSGTNLEKYSSALTGVEINTTFYRRHQVATYERWARSVPEGFRFAVKLPKTVTHESALVSPRRHLAEFFEDVRGLGAALGPVLVQLPASLPFQARRAATFFRTLRALHPGPVAFEPRHASWYDQQVGAILNDYEIARVAADPPRPAAARTAGGWPGLVYHRLHGSPRTYWSEYDEEYLHSLLESIRDAGEGAEIWCIFDNTASGAALGNALRLEELVNKRAEPSIARSKGGQTGTTLRSTRSARPTRQLGQKLDRSEAEGTDASARRAARSRV